MNRSQQGFTLMEVIVAITVLALIATCLYMALSTAARLWTRQNGSLSPMQRLETVIRLVRDDLSDARSYAFEWEEGQEFFFSGSSKAVFYVTGHALGASERHKDGLYFACLLLRPSERGQGEELWLIKNARPTEELTQALHDFAVDSPRGREDYEPQRELNTQAHLLLSGLEEATFSYARNSANVRSAEEAAEDNLPIENWQSESLPFRVRLHFGLSGEPYAVDAAVLAGSET